MIDARFISARSPAILRPCVSELAKAKTSMSWILAGITLLPHNDSRKKDVVAGRFMLKNLDDPSYPQCDLYWRIDGTWWVESVSRRTLQPDNHSDMSLGKHLRSVPFVTAQAALVAVDSCLFNPLELMAKSLDKPSRKERKRTKRNPRLDVAKLTVDSNLEESPFLNTWTDQVRKAVKKLSYADYQFPWAAKYGLYTGGHEIHISLWRQDANIFATVVFQPRFRKWWIHAVDSISAERIPKTTFEEPQDLVNKLEEFFMDPLEILAKEARRPSRARKTKTNGRPRIDTIAIDPSGNKEVSSLTRNLAEVITCVPWTVSLWRAIPDFGEPLGYRFRIRRVDTPKQWFSLIYRIKLRAWHVEETSSTDHEKEDQLRGKSFTSPQRAADAAEKLLLDPLEYLAHKAKKNPRVVAATESINSATMKELFAAQTAISWKASAERLGGINLEGTYENKSYVAHLGVHNNLWDVRWINQFPGDFTFLSDQDNPTIFNSFQEAIDWVESVIMGPLVYLARKAKMNRGRFR